MPITVKRRDKDDSSGDFGDTGEVFTVFKLAPRWFSLEQTEGEDYIEPVESPQWDAEAALAALDITLEHFDLMDGNVQGYAVKTSNCRQSAGRVSAQDPVSRDRSCRSWAHARKPIAMTPHRCREVFRKSRPKAWHFSCARFSICRGGMSREATSSRGLKAVSYRKSRLSGSSASARRFSRLADRVTGKQ